MQRSFFWFRWSARMNNLFPWTNLYQISLSLVPSDHFSDIILLCVVDNWRCFFLFSGFVSDSHTFYIYYDWVLTWEVEGRAWSVFVSCVDSCKLVMHVRIRFLDMFDFKMCVSCVISGKQCFFMGICKIWHFWNIIRHLHFDPLSKTKYKDYLQILKKYI